MTDKRRQAFLLTAVLQWLVVIGMTLTAGYAVMNRALLVQHRSSAWLADDTRLRHVLNRLRQDVATADRAEIVQAEVPILALRQAGRDVRYQQRDGAVVRSESCRTGQPIEHIWELDRCSLQWSIEQPPGGSALVWTGITQTIRPEGGPNPFVYRYATAARVGAAPAAEDTP